MAWSATLSAAAVTPLSFVSSSSSAFVFMGAGGAVALVLPRFFLGVARLPPAARLRLVPPLGATDLVATEAGEPRCCCKAHKISWNVCSIRDNASAVPDSEEAMVGDDGDAYVATTLCLPTTAVSTTAPPFCSASGTAWPTCASSCASRAAVLELTIGRGRGEGGGVGNRDLRRPLPRPPPRLGFFTLPIGGAKAWLFSLTRRSGSSLGAKGKGEAAALRLRVGFFFRSFCDPGSRLRFGSSGSGAKGGNSNMSSSPPAVSPCMHPTTSCPTSPAATSPRNCWKLLAPHTL